MAEDGLDLADVGGKTADVKLVQRSGGAFHCGQMRGGEARRTHHLGQQRIELRRRRIAHVATAVHAHASAGGFLVRAQSARATGHHACLHCESARAANGLLAADSERLQAGACGDSELRLHEVDAGHLLRDSVFHLDAGIALDEEVFAGFRHHQKLNCAGVDVVDGSRQLDGVVQDALSQRLVQARRGCGFHDLLVA